MTPENRVRLSDLRNRYKAKCDDEDHVGEFTIEEMHELIGLFAERVRELEAESERWRNAAQTATKEAADEIESWGGYSSEYFQDKHNLAGSVSRFRNADVSSPEALIKSVRGE